MADKLQGSAQTRAEIEEILSTTPERETIICKF